MKQEQALLKSIRGLTFTELSRLWRRANPGVDAAKVKKWKREHPLQVQAQRERAKQRKQRKRQGWAKRETELPF
jgi:hypothetical protein